MKLVRSFRNKKGGLPISCQAQVPGQIPGQVHARSGSGYSSNLILMGLTLKGDDLFPILVYIRELQRRMGTDPGKCNQSRLSSLMSRCQESPRRCPVSIWPDTDFCSGCCKGTVCQVCLPPVAAHAGLHQADQAGALKPFTMSRVLNSHFTRARVTSNRMLSFCQE